MNETEMKHSFSLQTFWFSTEISPKKYLFISFHYYHLFFFLWGKGLFSPEKDSYGFPIPLLCCDLFSLPLLSVLNLSFKLWLCFILYLHQSFTLHTTLMRKFGYHDAKDTKRLPHLQTIPDYKGRYLMPYDSSNLLYLFLLPVIGNDKNP